jgi:hypothetical protein
VSRIEGNGKRSLRRPKVSTRKFSAWKKKKKKKIRNRQFSSSQWAVKMKHPHIGRLSSWKSL